VRQVRKNVDHALDLCTNPKKFDKSSKAMESMGSVKTILDIWKNCSNAQVAAIVTDEDSTTRSKLSHSMAECVAAGTMIEAEPRYKPKTPRRLGLKKNYKGELPIEHPEIVKHSDVTYFTKNYKGELFLQVAMHKSKSETCKADAMKLSQNLWYMIGQCKPTRDNKDCTFEDFQKAGEASFEHHWNNHEHCGLWCQAKSWTEEEKVKGKGKYQDKETRERKYKQQLQVKEKYLLPVRLRMCFHEFCNNETEQIHGLVVNVFLPKWAFLC
jgi:hypothetical protein